jgi:hypothetical protein
MRRNLGICVWRDRKTVWAYQGQNVITHSCVGNNDATNRGETRRPNRPHTNLRQLGETDEGVICTDESRQMTGNAHRPIGRQSQRDPALGGNVRGAGARVRFAAGALRLSCRTRWCEHRKLCGPDFGRMRRTFGCDFRRGLQKKGLPHPNENAASTSLHEAQAVPELAQGGELGEAEKPKRVALLGLPFERARDECASEPSPHSH